MSETTDRPGIAERYITAGNGNDLIAAASLACLGQEKEQVALALLLWSVTHEGKSEHQKRLAELLGDRLNQEMDKRKRLKGDAWRIAKEMLAWHLHGICTSCNGRGYEQIKDTPKLSENLCSACHGTGKQPHPREAAHIWLASYLGTLTAIASSEVMKRLRTQMQLSS